MPLLLKVVGDQEALSLAPQNPFNWQVSPDMPLDEPRQMAYLVSSLGLASRGYVGGLPPDLRLHRGMNRHQPAEELDISATPEVNNLHANDYVYVVYDGASQEGSLLQDAEDEGGAFHPRPSTLPAPGSHAFGSRRNPNLPQQQGQIDALSRRLQETESENTDLRRQVLQLADEVRARNQLATPHASRFSNASPAPSEPSPQRPLLGTPAAGEEARQLQQTLNATRAELQDKTLRLETLEAWKAQHDCSVAQKKPSDLRTDINEMRNTLRGVASERERAKEELQRKRSHIEGEYHVQTARATTLVDDANAMGGAHLMPMPYYLDPYKAPASTYNNTSPEGTVCKLRVQTMAGDGSVVRRMYSSLTRDGHHAILLASLEGVVTDEIAAADLVKAGVGYNRPNLLFLATQQHRWVLELETKDRAKWLDWLIQTNPALAAQSAA